MRSVLAGFAFTMTTLPKISRCPAFVAFFWPFLIIATPEMTNLSVFFLSFCRRNARKSAKGRADDAPIHLAALR